MTKTLKRGFHIHLVIEKRGGLGGQVLTNSGGCKTGILPDYQYKVGSAGKKKLEAEMKLTRKTNACIIDRNTSEKGGEEGNRRRGYSAGVIEQAHHTSQNSSF